MATRSIKQQAREIVDALPEDAGWDELMRRIYVRKSIQKGVDDSEAGRTSSVDEIRREFGLDDS